MPLPIKTVEKMTDEQCYIRGLGYIQALIIEFISKNKSNAYTITEIYQSIVKMHSEKNLPGVCVIRRGGVSQCLTKLVKNKMIGRKGSYNWYIEK